MTNDQFQQFVDKVKNDPELLERLASVEGPEELQAIAEELGFDISAENLVDRVSEAYSSLSDQELEQITGGAAAASAWGQSTVCTDMCKLTCAGTKHCPSSPTTPTTPTTSF